MPKNKLLSTRSDAPTAAPHKPSKSDQDREQKYRAQEALSTLTRAAEIKKDSALMRDVKTLAKQTMNAVCPPKKK